MKQRVAWLLMLSAILMPAAQAQYASSTRGMARAYQSLVEQQCPKIAGLVDAARAEGDDQKLVMSQLFQQTMCTCQLVKLDTYLAGRTPDELSEQVDEQQFTALAVTHVVGPCMSEMMRETFAGKTCDRLMALSKQDSMKDFCGCMKPRLAAFTDTDAIEIGTSFADYIPLLAQSRKQGEPDPPRTPLMDRFIAATDQCGGTFLLAK